MHRLRVSPLLPCFSSFQPSTSLTFCRSNLANSSSVLHVSVRSFFLSEFFKSFRKQLKKNIEENPEFGGNLQRLQQSTKFTADPDATVTKVKNVARNRSKDVKNTIKKILRVIFSPLITNRPLLVTIQSLENGLLYLQLKAENFFEATAPKREEFIETPVGQSLRSILRPPPSFRRMPLGFSPVPYAPSVLESIKANTPTSLAFRTESSWEKTSKKMQNQWDEMGEGVGTSAAFVEKLDSVASFFKKISTSRSAEYAQKLKQIDPFFNSGQFARWVKRKLFPYIVHARMIDEFFYHHTNDTVKLLFQQNLIPTLCISRIAGCKMIPLDASQGVGYLFSIRAQTIERADEKEENEEYYRLRVCYTKFFLTVKRNDKTGVWQATDIQVWDKQPAVF